MKDNRFIDGFSVILLDMGNTFMFDGDRFGQSVDYYSTYRQLGGASLEPSEVRSHINCLIEGMLKGYLDPDCSERFATVYQSLRDSPKSASLPESELELLEDVIARHEVGAIPAPHARAIQRLARTHTLGIISNIWSGRSVFEEELSRVGILNLFATLVWSSDHGCVKPSPRLFEEALRRLDISADRVVYVGDDPRRDIAGAKGVGMKTVWIENQTRPLTPEHPQPNFIAADLAALLSAIAQD